MSITRRIRNPALEFGRYFVEFLAYSLVGILSLGINNLVIFVAVEYLALALLASKAVAAGATFAFNFGVRKFVLFRK